MLTRVGVRDAPDFEDALDVLEEIAADPAWQGFPVNAEVEAVVDRCWALLADAFARSEIDELTLHRLHDKRVVVDTNSRLNQPSRMFLADKGGLAEHFRDVLGPNLIPISVHSSAALEAAGVQRLSRSVEMTLLDAVDRRSCEPVADRVAERHNQIRRVTASTKSGDVASVLGQVTIERVDRLVVQYSLRLFDRTLPTPPVEPRAVLLADENLLLVEMAATAPWAALARELASALLPDDEAGGIAAGLLHALQPGSVTEADELLDASRVSQDRSRDSCPP